MSKRTSHPWPIWRRLLREILIWPLDLDDGTGDGSPSLTKIMALVAFVLAIVVVLNKIPVSGTQLTMIIIAISAAFGRGMWKLWLARGSWNVSASDTTARTEATTRTIVEQVSARRDPAAGYEVSK